MDARTPAKSTKSSSPRSPLTPRAFGSPIHVNSPSPSSLRRLLKHTFPPSPLSRLHKPPSPFVDRFVRPVPDLEAAQVHLRCFSHAAANKQLMQVTELSQSHLHTRAIYPKSCKADYGHMDPISVLDAPDLRTDFYASKLAWSSRNEVAIALGPVIYAKDYDTQSIRILHEFGSDVSALTWSADGAHYAVGLQDGRMFISKPTDRYKVIELRPAGSKVSALSWGPYLTAGTHAGKVRHYDVTRLAAVTVSRLDLGHCVCGLQWRKDGQVLAVGDAGGNVHIIKKAALTRPIPLHPKHDAAVRAVAWSPSSPNTLATAGGRADGKVKIWNVFTLRLNSMTQVGCQITDLFWHIRNPAIFLTIHGDAPDCPFAVWNTDGNHPARKIKGIVTTVGFGSGHAPYSAMSPRGQLATTGEDSLLVWDVWGQSASKSLKLNGAR